MIGQLLISSGPLILSGWEIGLDLIDDGPQPLTGSSAITWVTPERTLHITSPIREGGAMAILGIIDKQPREIVDVLISYTKVLAGRTADSITLTVETPSGMTLTGTDIGGDSARLYVAGGTSGGTYRWTVLADIAIGARLIRCEDEFVAAVQEAN